MAKRIAVVSGTALVPGVSKNGRLYTREAIAAAVARAQPRIAAGAMLLTNRLDEAQRELQPLSQRTHHMAEDDSTAIVGRLTSLVLADDGSAKFTADIANTPKGQVIASLADTSDGKPAFLRGVSIRGAWVDKPRTETIDGKSVQTADALELDGLDYTGSPGVAGAVIDSCVPVNESAAPGGALIYESVQEATVTADAAVETEADPAGDADAPVGEAKTPMSKRGGGLTGTGGPYADPGYLADKKQRYQLDTKARAKSAWSYIGQKDNAAQYTANQLKRIKQRIVKALKGFGVEVNTAEHYLVDAVAALTESTSLAECIGCYGEDPREVSSFYVTLTNGPVSVSVSSYRVDPADLDLIGRAAMDGACKALATLDPDMDGDIDVPGADAEDTDRDMPSANVPGTPCPCGCGCAIPLEPGDCPCVCVCDVCGDGEPVGEDAPDAVEAAPDPAAEAVEPAPQAAADPPTETEEPAVSEPTTAVEPTQAAPAPAAVTLSGEQFAQLLAAASAPRVAEAAPAPAAVPAPVTETQEQMIERLVSDGITKGVQKLVSTGALNPGRKGLVGRGVAENGQEQTLTELGIPEDWPQKPLHTYTAEERRKYIDNAMAEHVLGESLYTGKR